MELYIEKEFLDNFFMDDCDSPIKNVVRSLFAEYGSKRVFMDVSIDSPEELMYLKQDNPLFAKICDSNTAPPNPINSIEQHLFENSKFDQTLVFVYEKQSWFESAWKKGALCFCFESYKEDIKKIIQDLHFRIDLSQGFNGWDFLSRFKLLQFKELIVTDAYILSGKDNQKIDSDIVPIIKEITAEQESLTQIKIFTKNLSPLTNTTKHIEEKARKRHKLLSDIFPEFKKKIKIIMDGIGINPFDFHDRIIQTNYLLLECGKGFNLSRSKKSNSQIISESIFVKYTYDRLKNHRKMQDEYIQKLNRTKSSLFLMYPKP